MNIKDFLIDNYIWILAIILISIVTIIGFLADKKKSNKKKDSMTSPQPQPIEPINNNQQQMQYQPIQEQQMNNNQQIVDMNNLNQMSGPMNQNLNINQIDNNQNMGTIPQQVGNNINTTNNINQMNAPQPVENIVQEPKQEPIYQPLSEQKPNIPPQPVTNFDVIQNNNMPNNPQPNINQPIDVQDNNFTVPNMIPQDNNLNNGNNQLLQGQTTPINSQPLVAEASTMPQQNYNQQPNMINNNVAVPNMMPNMNQGTIPQPINPIPVPQPVNPQPINIQPMMQNQMMENNQMAQNQVYGMNQGMNNNFPNPQSMPMNQSTMPQQPAINQPSLNFVYGPQDNNQNM